MKSFYTLILFAMLTGCSSFMYHSDSRAPANYTYHNAVTCEETDSNDMSLSALSGYLVGPTSAKFLTDLQAPILRPFFSDGCSSAPDGIPGASEKRQWTDCCVQHDTKYWAGGSKEDKNKADANLEKCMQQKGYPNVAEFYKFFVKKFGGPNSYSSYRWGYGWNYARSYATLSAAEKMQIDNLNQSAIGQTTENLVFQSAQLVRMCSSTDTAFNKLSKEEDNIYALLNSKLQKNDVIEWGRWGYYNLEKREFELKLKSCDDLVVFVFGKKSSENPSISTNCEL